MPPTETTSDLRALRDSAQQVFDRLWDGSFKYHRHTGLQRRSVPRWIAYAWLAHHLGLPGPYCYFARLSETQCVTALRLCRAATPHTVSCWSRDHRHAQQLTPGIKPAPSASGATP